MKTVQLTGKNITQIIEKGDGDSTRGLKFVHENGTDIVYDKNTNMERFREIPKGHSIVGVYALLKKASLTGFGFITAQM